MSIVDVNDFCKIFGILIIVMAYTSFVPAATMTDISDVTFICDSPRTIDVMGYVTYEGISPTMSDLVITVNINGSSVSLDFDGQYITLDVLSTGTSTITVTATDNNGAATDTFDAIVVPNLIESNIAPVIDEIEDITMDYTESVSLDMWDYVTDYDLEDNLSNLNLSYSQTGTSVITTFDGRDLDFDLNHLGMSTVTVRATDSCNNMATENFDITYTNHEPVLRIEDMEVGCTQDLNQFVDLWDEVWDENVNSLDFNIYGQTNTTDLNCYLDSTNYLTCEAYTCDQVTSTISVRATDVFGEIDEATIDVSIVNEEPYWFDNMLNTCINVDTEQIFDLRDYVSDPEDGPMLDFSLTQANSSLMNCYIDDDYYLSCDGISNLNGENEITITAEDGRGLAAIDSVIMSANCFENVIFEADNMAVCMENFTTYAKSITLKNVSGVERCYDFYTEFDIEGVEATVTPSAVCVQPQETRTLTLSINAYNSQSDDYKLEVLSEDGTLAMEFDVGIGTCTNFDGFFVEEFDKTVCQGEKVELPVMVRNYSDQEKGINLFADNSYLLPYFERSTVTIDENSSKKVNLMVNAKYASLGFFDVQLEGDAQNYHITKNLELEVIDCSTIAKRTFILEVPGACQEVNKGDYLESYFTVKRTRETCSNPRDPLMIDFKTFGFETELGFDSKEVECFEEDVIEYVAFIDEDEEAGTHFLSIRADDGQFEETKEVCVNVLGRGESQFLLLTSPKDVAQGSTEIFELEIRNTGDFDEDFNLLASGMASGVSVDFSEDNFTVASGSTKIIYAAVIVEWKVPVGDSSIGVTLQGPETLTTEIRFNVVEGEVSQNLEFLSFTSEISTKGNSKTEYELIIRNNTNTDLNDIYVMVEGAPEDVNFEEIIIPQIKAGETYTILGEVYVGDTEGYYTASYVVSKNNMINKEEFSIYIEENPDSGVFSGLFGLFSLNGSEAIGSIGLALLLIILLIGIVLAVTYLRQPIVNEKWVAGELDE